MTSKYPTCCISNHSWFLGMVQNCRTYATFPGIISSVVAIIKAGNREICCRLRMFILFSIANPRMRLLCLFRCILKEESPRIKNMRIKEKVASRVRSWFLLSHAPILYDMFRGREATLRLGSTISAPILRGGHKTLSY